MSRLSFEPGMNRARVHGALLLQHDSRFREVMPTDVPPVVVGVCANSQTRESTIRRVCPSTGNFGLHWTWCRRIPRESDWYLNTSQLQRHHTKSYQYLNATILEGEHLAGDERESIDPSLLLRCFVELEKAGI